MGVAGSIGARVTAGSRSAAHLSRASSAGQRACPQFVELPEPIAAYFTGTNNHDTDTMLVPFDEAAIVKDEGRERRGLAEIQKWIEETTRKYSHTIAVTDIGQTTGKTVVTGLVSGNFPGSPVELRHIFTVADDKISRLEIVS